MYNKDKSINELNKFHTLLFKIDANFKKIANDNGVNITRLYMLFFLYTDQTKKYIQADFVKLLCAPKPTVFDQLKILKNKGYVKVVDHVLKLTDIGITEAEKLLKSVLDKEKLALRYVGSDFELFDIKTFCEKVAS